MTDLENAPTPVADWENRSVGGLAKLGEGLYENRLAKVAELRAREAAYRETLPASPEEKCDAVRKIWINDDFHSRGYLREAQAIAQALDSMVETCDPENTPEERDAMRWLTDRLIDCQREEYKRIDKAMDILRS